MKKHFTSSLNCLLALALALLVLSSILGTTTAQDLSSELITYPSKVLEQLPAKHRQVVSELTALSGRTAHLVRLNPIKEAVKDNSITITLPGGASKTKILLDKIEYFDADNYLVVGKVDKTPLTAIFSSYEGRKGGLIQGLESTYEIYDLEEEGQLLVKSNNADTERGFCGIKDAKVNPPLLPQEPVHSDRKSAANARVDPCTSNIRVLFLYTSGISQSTAFSFATNTISALNTTISQSGVNNSLAYAQVAGYTSINYNKSPNLSIGEEALKLSTDNTAQNLRTQYKADLVMLITNDTWGTSIGGVPNPADVPHPNSGRAYGIVSLAAGGTATVGAHELSHFYGCNHQDVAYGLYYSKALVWGSNPTHATLVASGNSPGTRLLEYSNPTTTGSGYLPEHNNTQVMSSNAGGVKNFQPEPNDLSAYIDGPNSGIAYHMYTFESVVSCGSAPYSYQWQVSTDGFNYGSVIGTGEYFNTHLYHNGNHWHYIKLTVTSADNQTKQATRQVWVDDNNPYRTGVEETMVSANSEEPFGDGILFPNPVTSTAKVNLDLTETGWVIVDIYSVNGTKLVSHINQVMEKGNYQLSVPVDKYNLPDGIYLIRIVAPGSIKAHKIKYSSEK